MKVDELIGARLIKKGVFEDLIEVETLSGLPPVREKRQYKFRVLRVELMERIKKLLHERVRELSFEIEISTYPSIPASVEWRIPLLLLENQIDREEKEPESGMKVSEKSDEELFRLWFQELSHNVPLEGAESEWREVFERELQRARQEAQRVEHYAMTLKNWLQGLGKPFPEVSLVPGFGLLYNDPLGR